MNVKNIIESSISVKQALLKDALLLKKIEDIANIMITAFQQDNKLWLCGNGGSAADAQHIASEFSGRFLMERPPLFAEALTVNTSYLTAVANDYGYEQVFARLVQGKARKGDVLIAISTSGNSKNIVAACKKAKEIGVIVVAMTGDNGGEIRENNLCDFLLNVPSNHTPRIQEAHILVGHVLCELVEDSLFG